MKVSRKYLGLALVLALLAQASCTPDDVSKVKKKVADAAVILNSAAKSNRTLYQSGIYGVAGSPEAISKRQTVAKGIFDANEYLSMAVERAASLTASDLPTGKTVIVALLQKAVQALNSVHVGNDKIQLVISSAVTAINAAIVLTQAIKG